jgi:transcription termination factor Rho
MSVGSQALERSTLESKDRESLQQIATAMGGKPTSRAKKADIVDMILDLAGVTSGAASAPAASDDDDAKAAPRKRAVRAKGTDDDVATSDETATAAPAARSARTAPTEDASAEPDDTEDLRVSDRTREGQGARNGRNGQDQARGQSAAGQGGASPRSQSQGSATTAQGQSASGQGQGQGQGAQGQGQGQAQGEDGDGNRRRRRRGRDRNREGQPEVQGQQPRQGQGQVQGQGQGQQSQPEEQFVGEPVEVAGLLDLRDEGYGFLRLKGYLPSKDDVYVSVKQVRQFGLRKGDHLKGAARPASRNEKNPALLRIDEVNAADPDANKARPRFEELTPSFPDEQLRLEVPADPTNMTARIIDLVAPIGKGQRGLIVSPPKAGKTTIMKQIARSIETNNPDVHLMVLLVDERPEEVTDMRRWVQGEVVASTFDRPADEHTMVAELALERAKRLVEDGKDVVIILDGITRLARAYNLAAPATGRSMSGGIDTGALYPPKKFFGSARNVEEGGSLTILATALVETGSRMDEVIFEEFKGTGNMELRLDRRLAERRIYPAIDVDGSSTRHEELLFDEKELQLVWKLRRVLSGMASDAGSSGAGLEMLVERLSSFKTNAEFLAEVAKAPTPGA